MQELGKQAMDMFREASEVNNKAPTGLAFGFSQERRGTSDLDSVGRGRGGGPGFEPVQAKED
jgi:hypothetical protein